MTQKPTQAQEEHTGLSPGGRSAQASLAHWYRSPRFWISLGVCGGLLGVLAWWIQGTWLTISSHRPATGPFVFQGPWDGLHAQAEAVANAELTPAAQQAGWRVYLGDVVLRPTPRYLTITLGESGLYRPQTTPQNAKPHVGVQRLRVSVALWPLLQQQVQLNAVYLSGLQLTLDAPLPLRHWPQFRQWLLNPPPPGDPLWVVSLPRDPQLAVPPPSISAAWPIWSVTPASKAFQEAVQPIPQVGVVQSGVLSNLAISIKDSSVTLRPRALFGGALPETSPLAALSRLSRVELALGDVTSTALFSGRVTPWVISGNVRLTPQGTTLAPMASAFRSQGHLAPWTLRFESQRAQAPKRSQRWTQPWQSPLLLSLIDQATVEMTAEKASARPWLNAQWRRLPSPNNADATSLSHWLRGNSDKPLAALPSWETPLQHHGQVQLTVQNSPTILASVMALSNPHDSQWHNALRQVIEANRATALSVTMGIQAPQANAPQQLALSVDMVPATPIATAVAQALPKQADVPPSQARMQQAYQQQFALPPKTPPIASPSVPGSVGSTVHLAVTARRSASAPKLRWVDCLPESPRFVLTRWQQAQLTIKNTRLDRKQLLPLSQLLLASAGDIVPPLRLAQWDSLTLPAFSVAWQPQLGKRPLKTTNSRVQPSDISLEGTLTSQGLALVTASNAPLLMLPKATVRCAASGGCQVPETPLTLLGEWPLTVSAQHFFSWGHEYPTASVQWAPQPLAKLMAAVNQLNLSAGLPQGTMPKQISGQLGGKATVQFSTIGQPRWLGASLLLQDVGAQVQLPGTAGQPPTLVTFSQGNGILALDSAQGFASRFTLGSFIHQPPPNLPLQSSLILNAQAGRPPVLPTGNALAVLQPSVISQRPLAEQMQALANAPIRAELAIKRLALPFNTLCAWLGLPAPKPTPNAPRRYPKTPAMVDVTLALTPQASVTGQWHIQHPLVSGTLSHQLNLPTANSSKALLAWLPQWQAKPTVPTFTAHTTLSLPYLGAWSGQVFDQLPQLNGLEPLEGRPLQGALRADLTIASRQALPLAQFETPLQDWPERLLPDVTGDIVLTDLRARVNAAQSPDPATNTTGLEISSVPELSSLQVDRLHMRLLPGRQMAMDPIQVNWDTVPVTLSSPGQWTWNKPGTLPPLRLAFEQLPLDGLVDHLMRLPDVWFPVASKQQLREAQKTAYVLYGIAATKPKTPDAVETTEPKAAASVMPAQAVLQGWIEAAQLGKGQWQTSHHIALAGLDFSKLFPKNHPYREPNSLVLQSTLTAGLKTPAPQRLPLAVASPSGGGGGEGSREWGLVDRWLMPLITKWGGVPEGYLNWQVGLVPKTPQTLSVEAVMPKQAPAQDAVQGAEAPLKDALPHIRVVLDAQKTPTQGDRLRLQDIDLTLGTLGQVLMQGEVTHLAQPGQRLGTLSVHTPEALNARALAPWLGEKSKGTIDIQFEGELKEAGNPMLVGEASTRNLVLPKLMLNKNDMVLTFNGVDGEFRINQTGIPGMNIQFKGPIEDWAVLPWRIANADLTGKTFAIAAWERFNQVVLIDFIQNEVLGRFASSGQSTGKALTPKSLVDPTAPSAQPAAALLPFELVDARIAVDEAIYNNILLEKVTGGLQLSSFGYVQLQQLKARVADGDLVLNVTMDSHLNNYTVVDLQAKHVKANPLASVLLAAPNEIFGDLDGRIQFTTQGQTNDEMLLNTNGLVEFGIVSGRLPTVAKIETLLAAANTLRGGVLGLNLNNLFRTLHLTNSDYIANINGTLNLNQGSALTDNLRTQGTNLSLLGQGSIRLTDGLADMVLYGDMSQNVQGLFGKVGQFSLSSVVRYIPGLGFIPGKPKYGGVLSYIPGVGYVPGLGGRAKDVNRFKAIIKGPLDSPQAIRSFEWVD